jgi:hypothetical protein
MSDDETWVRNHIADLLTFPLCLKAVFTAEAESTRMAM